MKRKMTVNGLKFLFLFFVLSVFSGPLALAQPPSSGEVLGDARLSLIQGDVVLQTEETGSEWGAAVINTPLLPGTKLWNPENGRSEIQFFGGSYLRSSANTEVDITTLNRSGSSNVIQVGVPAGRAYVNYVGFRDDHSLFQLDTPVTSIISYEPSRFEVDIHEDGYTEVSVLNGRIEVQSRDGVTTVDAGTMLSMSTNQFAELSPMRADDDWRSWNVSRDSALAYGGPSRTYLPTSLSTYGHDFDSYGRWVDTADYGHVWTPLHVTVDWAPYRIGRWCWIGGEYVWVSYEPWGWVPYHYGRWAFQLRLGWFWVPPPRTARVSWSPGFVAWIHTPTYVSWVPLAPGEIYYGRRHYGPHSVNITNININKIKVTNVYKNIHVNNAVTVVSKETFLTGRRTTVANAPANPFRTREKIAIGGPALKPVKATALPDPVRVVPEKVLPPKEVRTKAVQVERRRPAVQKNVSVFKPGERVAPMQVKKVDAPKPIASARKPAIKEESRPSTPDMVRPQTQPPQSVTPNRERTRTRTTPEVVTPPTQQPQSASPNREPINTPQNQGESWLAPRQERQTGGPPQRQMGNAPNKREFNAPLAGKEQNKPTRPLAVTPPAQQRPSVTPDRQRVNTPRNQRDVSPPSMQERSFSSQRQMGSAPPHRGGIEPPAVREPMRRPSAPDVVMPQRQLPQSFAPNRERMSTPPARREVSPPPAQRGQQERPAGIAPPFGGATVTPPARRQGMNKPPAQGMVKPHVPRRELGG